MKKIGALLLLLIFVFALPVQAEKIRFKDKDSDFKNYSRIQFMGIATVQIDNTDFEIDTTAESKVKMMLLSALNKKNLTVDLENKAGEVTPKYGFDVKIYVFGNDKIWHEAWVENVSSYKTIYVDDYDKHGHRYSKSISIPYTEQRYHPAGYYYTARVDLEINVNDLRNNKLIYSIRDTRARGGETDTAGMLKRICEDFADDITRNG